MRSALQQTEPFAENTVAARLSHLASPSEAALRRVGDALGAPVALPMRSELVSDRRCRFATPVAILSGFVAHVRLLADGRRQIMRLTLPGEIVDPEATAHVSRDSIVTLSEAVLAPLDAAAFQGDEALAEGFARSAALAQLELLNQIARLGRQSAIERTAHLLLELHDRLGMAGLSVRGRFELPLTQETLADVLGLTPVHLNRTVQQLRREDLIELNRHSVRIPDPAHLAEIADYCATPYAKHGAASERPAFSIGLVKG